MYCENCPYDDIVARQERCERHHTSENLDYQPEYLWCDKVGGKHLQYGYCSDCGDVQQISKNTNFKKNSDRSTRRRFSKLKDKRLKRIIRSCSYGPHRGYIEEGFVDDMWCEIGTYVKYPRDSDTQKWIKKMTSRKLRKVKDVPGHNGYRRYIDYWNIMY